MITRLSRPFEHVLDASELQKSHIGGPKGDQPVTRRALMYTRHFASRATLATYGGLVLAFSVYLIAGLAMEMDGALGAFSGLCQTTAGYLIVFCLPSFVLAGFLWGMAAIATIFLFRDQPPAGLDGGGNGSGKPEYHNDNSGHDAATDSAVPESGRAVASSKDAQSGADGSQASTHPVEDWRDRGSHFRAA